MARFNHSDDLRGSEFKNTDLRESRFFGADLSNVVMRGVELQGADLDAPWLFEGDATLLVNGVNVIPLIDAELNRRFPGRADRAPKEPAGLQDSWRTIEATWARTIQRVETLPAETVDISVKGEWSFAQTLRHLTMATDTWLRGAILGIEQPYHPNGQPHGEYEIDGYDMSVFTTVKPSFAEVLEARAGRVAMVREFIADVTPAELTQTHKNPWAPQYPATTLSCLHVIFQEEWEHHRYAVRDLDILAESGH